MARTRKGASRLDLVMALLSGLVTGYALLLGFFLSSS